MLPANESHMFPSAARRESSSFGPRVGSLVGSKAPRNWLRSWGRGQGQDHAMLALPLMPEHVSFLLRQPEPCCGLLVQPRSWEEYWECV